MTRHDGEMRKLLNAARDMDDPTPSQRAQNRLGMVGKFAAFGISVPGFASAASAGAAANLGLAAGGSVWGWLVTGILVGASAVGTVSLTGDDRAQPHDMALRHAIETPPADQPTWMRTAAAIPQRHETPVATQTNSRVEVEAKRRLEPTVSSSAAIATTRLVRRYSRSEESNAAPSTAAAFAMNQAPESPIDGALETAKPVFRHAANDAALMNPVPAGALERSAAHGLANDPGATMGDLTKALAVLGDAQAYLAAGRPDQALSVLDEYAVGHRRGPMQEERQALRIVALCQAGSSQGPVEAQRFLLASPKSPMMTRVWQTCKKAMR